MRLRTLRILTCTTPFWTRAIWCSTTQQAPKLFSTVITTDQGLILVLPVAGHPPYKVFWSSDEPRIEAVFPRP